MTPRDLIQAQLDVLRLELARAERAVQSPDIDEPLRRRVLPRFDKELKRIESRRDALAEQVSAGQPLGALWGELRKLQTDASTVFDECLAFIQGARARKAGLDEGICALTDALLDDLAYWSDVPWGRFTLLATSEFYRETAGIVRIRYPEASLWSIPLAAHEFGHYLGPALRASANPLAEEADEEFGKPEGQKHSSPWHHVQEHFADLFAACALGPAYAAALIGLRMNPGEAFVDTYTHPCGAARVHGVFWVLDKLADKDPALLFSSLPDATTRLHELWKQSLVAAGRAATLADAQASRVQERMSALYDLLAHNTPKRLALGWSDLLRADELANRLSEAAGAFATDLYPEALPAGLTRRDVLNAAWFARLVAADQSPQALHPIARLASSAYRRLPQLQT